MNLSAWRNAKTLMRNKATTGPSENEKGFRAECSHAGSNPAALTNLLPVPVLAEPQRTRERRNNCGEACDSEHDRGGALSQRGANRAAGNISTNQMQTKMNTPVMDEEDIEKQLRDEIKRQANLIKIAQAYIAAGRPDLASEVLAAAHI